MNFKELRQATGMNIKQYSEYFNIPYRTVQNWDNEIRKCPDYLQELMEYKLRKENIVKETYRIILTPEENSPHKYTVHIPDFDIYTEGDGIEHAKHMAIDAMGIVGTTMQDTGMEIPKPGAAKHEAAEGEIEVYVEMDFVEYRRKKDNKKG